jgi:hypothetical protein
MQLPITGRPSEVIEYLCSVISCNIKRSQFDEFYVGRSGNLIETRRRHGCDLIYPLYKTSSVGFAMDVEDYLINKFYDHPKCSNDARHCGGGVCALIFLVYIALWLR